MALNLPLEYLLTDLELRFEDGLEERFDGLDSVDGGGLSKTVKAAKSMLGFSKIESMSLPTGFLGDSGRLM